MRFILSFLLLLLFTASCGSIQKPATKTVEANKLRLPKMDVCGEQPEVYDPEFIGERNHLSKGERLSYSHTYHAIYHPADSAIREGIRFQNAQLARTMIALQFPDIEIAEDRRFRQKSYSDISYSVAVIKSHRPSEKRKRKLIEQLVVPAEAKKQLFIEIKSYWRNNSLKNVMGVYVFDTQQLSLEYYDYLAFYCDPRDQAALSKVFAYALEKIQYVSR